MKKYLLTAVAAVVAVLGFAFTQAPQTQAPNAVNFVYIGPDMSLPELSDPDNWEQRAPGTGECSFGEVACQVSIGDPTITDNDELATKLSTFANAGLAEAYLTNSGLENQIVSRKE